MKFHLLLLVVAAAVPTVEAEGPACSLTDMTAEELLEVVKAKELACWKLLETIRNNEKKNVKPTAEQVEIRDECLVKYTEPYLKNKYGKWWKTAFRFGKDKFNAFFGKVKTIPCYNDDKILKIFYKTSHIFPIVYRRMEMKLLFLLLVFGTLLSVKARGPKIPVPLEYDDETETDDVAAELEDAEVKEASADTCPLEELSAKERIDVTKAKEHTCYKLLEKIKENLNKNERATNKQWEIKTECLKRHTEQYLQRGYGGRYYLERAFIRTFKKLIKKIKTISCYTNDKILEYAVGFWEGKYD